MAAMTGIQQIFVWTQDPHGRFLRAGTLRVRGPDPVHGTLTGAFRYEEGYLANAGAFPLDPIHLPLSPEVFEARRPRSGVQGVFEDALPDEWGRALLIRRHQLSATESRVPDLLLVMGGEGMGALSFSARRSPRRTDPSVALRDLESLVQAVADYEQSGALPSDLAIRALLRAGSSPGGARPKALVRDGAALYLAKFPSAKDPVGVDMVRVEAASLALARQAGIETAETRVVLCGSRPVLLSRRFDVSPQGGRYHQISLQSLMGVDGYYFETYGRLAEVIGRVSSAPNIDRPAIYRRIVFHALLGHTDDHLKNILMQHDGQGFRLAPAFDLAPDVFQRGEHILGFGTHGPRPSRTALADLGAVCGLSSEQAGAIRAQVAGAVKGWDAVFAQEGVSPAERSRYAPDIKRRLAVVGAPLISQLSVAPGE